jgi:hypothetical protein
MAFIQPGAAGTRGAPGAALCQEAGAEKNHQELCFLSCSARRFSSDPEPWGHAAPQSCPASGGRCWSLEDTCRPRSCSKPGGGNRSRGDTRRSRSYHAWPQSCPKPGGGNQSRGDTRAPGVALRREAGAASGAALS